MTLKDRLRWYQLLETPSRANSLSQEKAACITYERNYSEQKNMRELLILPEVGLLIKVIRGHLNRFS